MDQNNGELLPQETPEENNKIIQINIEEQMKTAYIDYSMSVIVGRALPDVRDGLKPVHRRVLFAMHELGNTFNKPYKKCARIVGEVLGKYHPHGDTAVYDAMVRMAQPWSMRYTMVDGQGNYGSQDGDNPAAMRYTEARMQRLGEAMMDDIEKETVDFQLNFDDSLEEPTVLPTRIPQLLVNGSSGIAVGMATNMMPHNLTEIIDGCLAYIDNKEITIEDLMKYVKAPDFPTGGIIYGIEGIKQGFLTGRGRVVLRGRVTVETMKSGKEQIIITEVPYQVSRDALTEKIGVLVNNKVIEGITHVANESNKEGTRIVVELRRDVVAQVIINQLYKYSELQTSYGINNVALVNGRPRTLNLKDLISELHSTTLAKKPKQLSKVMTLKIEHLGGANGGGVAWHAIQQRYYTAITGNTYYPMFMYSADGKRIGDTTMNTMFDVRGLWYNTLSGTLQTNGYKNFGIAEYVLDNDGMPESVKKLPLPSRQPDEQCAGAYDTANKVLYFFEKSSGNIIRENFSGSSDTVVLHLGIKKKRKVKGHKNSTVIARYNENTCIYSGIEHKEIGLLNAKEKQIELYSAETGLLKKVYKLPADAPLEYSLNFSCSNGIYWLFDKKKREWRGYQ